MQTNPWLYIDLGANYTVQSVTIYAAPAYLYTKNESFTIQVGNVKPTAASGVSTK